MSKGGDILVKVSVAALVAAGSVGLSVPAAAQANNGGSAPPQDEAVSGDAPQDLQRSDIIVVARGQGTRDARLQNLQTVDAIGPRDIDSLPSQNISDVLKRLPGVQVTYDNGEAQQPKIRGVDYIQTTVDGRETVTASFRALQIGDVPGDLVNSVEVFKTPSANMIEGGIGGLVAIKTKKPLDYTKPMVAGQISGSMDEKRGKVLPQGAISAGGSWDTGIGRVGASIGVQHTAVLLRSDFFITGYNKGNTLFDINRNGAVGDEADTAIYPSFALPIQINARHKRDALIGNLQWAPNDELTLDGSFFYSRYLDNSQQYALAAAPGATNSAANASQFTLLSDSPIDVPVVRSGTYANVPFTSQSLYVLPMRKVTQQSLSATWERERVTLSAQGDFTQSKNNNDILIFAASTTAPNLIYTGVTSPGRSSIATPGLDITDPATFTTLNYTEILQRNSSSGNSQRLDFEFRPGGFLTAIQVGYRRTFRRSTADQAFASTPVTGTLASISGLAALSPDEDFVVANPNLFINKSAFRTMIGLSPQLPGFAPASFFQLRERTDAIYARAVYEFQLGGIPIDGDVGIRGVRNKNNGRAFAIGSDGSATPISNTGKTTDWLPSASLRAKLTDTLTMRMSASRTVARPGFSSLSPGLTLNADLTGGGGNPNLKSFYATGVDAGLDWLFAPSGYATVAVFHKKLKGLVQNQINEETINGIVYRISRPFNGNNDSSFSGVEVTLNKKFVELPGLLSGLGMDVNYTYLKSELTNAAGVKTRIPGLSTHTLNSSAYYDRGPLLVRVGYTITTDFVNNANFGGPVELTGEEIFGRQDVMDLTVQYKLTDNLRLTASAMNVLQPKVGYYNGYKETPNNSYQTYGRYQVGMKFDF